MTKKQEMVKGGLIAATIVAVVHYVSHLIIGATPTAPLYVTGIVFVTVFGVFYYMTGK